MKRNEQASGFTFIELMISLVVLVVAVGGLVAASTSALTLHTTAKENLLAKEAAVQTFETLRSYALDNFALTFRKFNGSAGDNPDITEEDGFTAGMVVGAVETVAIKQYSTTGDIINSYTYETTTTQPRMVYRLASFQTIDPQAVVAIDFPGDGVGLYEDLVPADMGGPMDLDGDGVISNFNVADSYKLLPVTVTVNWTSKTGRKLSVSYHAIMGSRR